MCFVTETILVLLLVVSYTESTQRAHNENDEKLDHLYVTWYPPQFNNPYAFSQLPRTKQDAIQKGCKFVDNGCQDPKLHHVGERYYCNDTLDVLLIFDKNGYVAGIQMLLPKEVVQKQTVMDYTKYPASPVETINGTEFCVLTGYFINPSRICVGRTEKEFFDEGTVKDIYYQNGTDPIRDSRPILMYGDNTTLIKEDWLEGKCIPGMGKHYNYNSTEDMDCGNFFPFMPMYDETSVTRRITAFSWVAIGVYPSNRFEFAPKGSLAAFVKVQPKCLEGVWDEAGGVTGFHVLFVRKPLEIGCNE